ncbi:MFS transporter [Lactiplantibacillus plantarum]|uniref:MFS transporter n=1 Tax=Lactiplantibacillus plantarum TaxID=1590 RepID=UPI0021A84160|nr:MFS transporter [Lactiplantibacillus plantarum]MCT3215991.1 MFS transporter [Lactiplantibacillus plantarum]MCT3270404.1 MFS transporter [Lactiplantibacillus plantarum]
MKKNLFVATLVSYLGIYITMPVLSAISTQAHLSPGQIGIMISLGAFAMLLFAPIWGKLSDKFGRKPVIVIGLIGMGLLFILYIELFRLSIAAPKTIKSLVALLIGTRFLLGIFMTTAPTSANAYMADISSPEDRAKDMSSLGFATGLSMVVGPIIGGGLASIGNLTLPFYVSIALLILFGILMIFLLPTAPKKTPAVASISKPTASKKFFSFQLFGWLIAGCSTMFVVVGLQLLTSLYLHDAIGQSVIQSAKTASLLFVILGISLMIIQIAQIKFFNWTAKQMMTRSIILIILGLLLIVLANNFVFLIVSYIVIGAGAGLGMSSLSAGASLAVSQDNQGSAAGAVAMTQGIAGIVSPLLGSFVYQINIKLPFIFFALFTLLAYVLFLLSNKKDCVN